jgi:hypothetical protein
MPRDWHTVTSSDKEGYLFDSNKEDPFGGPIWITPIYTIRILLFLLLMLALLLALLHPSYYIIINQFALLF